MALLNRFLADRSGVTAMTFALAIVPVMGLAGAAVDYGRASAAKAELQRAADATALHMAREALAGRTTNVDAVFAAYAAQAGISLDGIAPTATPVDATTIRVDVSATMRTTIASFIVPTVDIGVSATAAALDVPAQTETETEEVPMRYAIERAVLSVEASDYNELRAYCYSERLNTRRVPQVQRDPNRQGDVLDPADLVDASEFIKIADNTDAGVAAPTQSFEMYCRAGEQLSFQLINIRDARTRPAARATNQRFDHFTDATVRDGVTVYNTSVPNLLETILCTTRAQCDPRSPERIIPGNQQRNRDPAVNTRACAPGQFMYFGFEDRPPGLGWTDRDYDDIRVVMSCGVRQPQLRETTREVVARGRVVRLVD